ncbi:RTA1-like protein, 7 TM, responds to xenobiotic stimuli [Trichoderma parareesei]|uniref:RTA1-like protein, 7 TM, responds to xenobiotic stimuli n=1 Tax=Trichoderma parareesei TaxID=858221 RepID=A0A2H3A5Y1_TRIPA|nr:RTA1-like protein, 7 TM, responds to xenobiotic stimuli [Trichoderma parareesei]
MSQDPPPGTITFGSDTTCNLHSCPVEWSIYGYRPSLVANVIFVVLFAIAGIVHLFLGFRWRTWGFTIPVLIGCITEIIGYVGRIILWNNPFSFDGFIIQIVTLTIAPVFYTASIYVTLSQSIMFLDPSLSRFRPQLFYWIFIPFDIVCLVLQAAGGAMSAEDTGSDQAGVDISQAGLSLQVIVLVAFIVAFGDYMFRYIRSGRASNWGWRLTAFFSGLTTATVLILARCAYRVAELKDGYDGSLIKEEATFIVLEGVFVFLAAVALCFGQPGLGLKREAVERRKMESDSDDVEINPFGPRV